MCAVVLFNIQDTMDMKTYVRKDYAQNVIIQKEMVQYVYNVAIKKQPYNALYDQNLTEMANLPQNGWEENWKWDSGSLLIKECLLVTNVRNKSVRFSFCQTILCYGLCINLQSLTILISAPLELMKTRMWAHYRRFSFCAGFLHLLKLTWLTSWGTAYRSSFVKITVNFKLLGKEINITVVYDFPFRKQIQQVPGVRRPDCKAEH